MQHAPEAIEAARVTAGISKRALALRADMTPSTLIRKLRGDTPFDVDEIAALAIALNVPITALLPKANGDAA